MEKGNKKTKHGKGDNKEKMGKDNVKADSRNVEAKGSNEKVDTKVNNNDENAKKEIENSTKIVKMDNSESKNQSRSDTKAGVGDTETKSNTEFDTGELEKLSRTLELMLHDVKVNKQITEQNRTVVQNARTTARETIRKLRVEVNNFFNKLENAVDKKVEQMRNDDFHILSVLSSECEDLRKKIEIINKYVDKHVKDCKPIDDLETVRREMDHLETSIRKLSIENTVHEYVFETSEEMHDMFKNVKRLGNLLVETEKKKTVIRMSEVKLNDKCEKEPLIPFLSGLSFVADDILVAADYENRCMKVINVADDKIISVLPMNTEPWDVANVQKDLLAVTLPQKKKIQFLNMNLDALSKGHEIAVSAECHGIDSRNNKLYVTFVEPPKVEILDINGDVSRCIELNQQGYDLFSWPGYVTLAPENTGSTSMYVTDKDRNTVTHLSEDGKVEAVYGGDSLKGPRGVAVDENGHVFVCGRASNDLCQIMLSSGKVEFLLERSQGLKQPHGIVWHGNRVYISSCGDKMIKSWEIV